ncbi:Asp23/Gls24 family envelope stress response protein [Rugamonas rivuli]|uniref:Uncharacterized protein n=1 Tax=Rugamonas rivuli TaxID=2743358 RepID=A0A843S9Y6_9BURK|nr:hypothetical protein [Rugamonas rivuli]MQA19288.1 hypothetical protein [Rugamonas rivuli]
MKVLSLKCENCGAQLDVGPKASTCVCSYCGGEQLVERGDEDDSPLEQEEMLEEVGLLIMNRMASERAIARFESDISDICEERDSNIQVLHKTQEKEGCLVLLILLIGAIAATIFLAWFSISFWFLIPIIFFQVMLVAVLLAIFRPRKETETTIEASAEAKMAPLKEQIARHQAIIDSCDYGTTGES